MRLLLLLRPCCFDLCGPLIGLCGHTEKLFSKAVCESRQRTRHGQSFIAAYGKVNDGVVNGVIANESAGMCKPRHFWRQIERIDFVRESSPVGFSGIHHALYTDPKHGAGCARRQIDDLLRFFKNFFGVTRHAVGSRNSCSYGIANYSMNLESSAPAMRTTPQADLFRRIELAFVMRDSEPLPIRTSKLVGICPRFAFFEKSFQHWMLSKHCRYSAMRTFHFFRLSHWSYV